jgi:beta-xylosidase
MKTTFLKFSSSFYSYSFFYLLLMALLTPINASGQENKTVPLADPYILLNKGNYYAYGTHSEKGIEVYQSVDLRQWHYKGLALKKDDVWGNFGFWAPEVYKIKGLYYMFYTAEEHICVATSKSPAGPFTQQEKRPIIINEKSIDCSLFKDDNGKFYLFFVRFNDGNNIWVAEMNKDLKSIKKETLHPCIHVSQDWEKVWPRVNEGPFVIKHKGIYYMTYSANSYESQMYGIGCATAKDVMGEWKKYPNNPILQKPGSLVGVGHHSIFKDKRGQLMVVFHAHHDSLHIHPRHLCITKAYFENDSLKMSPNYFIPTLKADNE